MKERAGHSLDSDDGDCQEEAELLPVQVVAAQAKRPRGPTFDRGILFSLFRHQIRNWRLLRC